jgi:alanyl-tRNA synthetase
MKTNEIRKKFLDYFAKQGHTVVPSSSLIPAKDPTLLFTNAGMNQFKDVFLGKETRPFSRATSAQCCFRASDLEKVGVTARHHTFFEMLGNFSFGDYFKREAIHYAWEFLTKILKILPEKLSVTVYQDDDEAEKIWLKEIKIDPKNITRRGAEDNFWSMGDTGPCGPCSEIFYDHDKEILEKDDRYVEIWNLVFMQYNRFADGTMQPLPKPSVDTGMGLERIAAVMQGTHDNYAIDIFQKLIKEIAKVAKVKIKNNIAVRVIADHIRSASFLVAEGVTPSNEGRGYLLRRIIRRAVRYGNELYVTEPFFYKLVPILVKEMGAAYPQLIKSQKLIERVLYQEEEQFAVTLQQGLKVFDQELAKLTDKVIPGEVVFRLYDTYGFPPEVTIDIAQERGFSVDEQGLTKEMVKQRQRSKESSQFVHDYTKVLKLKGSTKFVGYDKTRCKAKIVNLFKNGKEVKLLKTGDKAVVILDCTPFYAEAGGQIGDIGDIGTDSACFHVTDTQKQGEVYVHYGYIETGVLEVSDKVTAKIDSNRQAITLNHSATHLLHAALQEILGSHVEQKGSLVNAERLRFDFSHFEPITAQQIQAIEQLVNQKIRANLPATRKLMSLAEAKKKGAMALFDEKYADQVCVVSMGDFSMELCGGTHVNATGEIGLFKIISESGIAAGIRRIEAITGEQAFLYVEKMEEELKNVAVLLKTEPHKIIEKLHKTLEYSKEQEKELLQLKSKVASSSSSNLAEHAVDIQGIKVLATKLEKVDSKTIRSTIDNLRQKLGSSVILLASVADNQIQLVAGVSKDNIGKIHAGKLMQYVTAQIGGKGGGKPDMAQGGGTDVKALDAALTSVSNWVASELKIK